MSPLTTRSMTTLKSFTVAAALSLCAGFCFAQTQQKPPSPEEMQKIMDATMGSMVPMMGKMTEVMIDAQLNAAARPETAERMAAFKKNLYDALLKKGFTQDQALQITVATALPMASPSK